MAPQEEAAPSVRKKKVSGVDTDWRVVLLITLISFVGIAMFRTMGYQYVTFMHEYNVDRETASWPHSLMTGLSGMAGLLVGTLHKRFSATFIAIAGSILAWAGLMACALAYSIFLLSITLGVIHSVGVGIVFVLLQVFIAMYFDKYRGTVVGIAAVGMTASGFVFTKLLEFFNDTYGFRPSFLIMGALLMNLSPLTYMLKVPPWLRKRTPSSSEPRTSSVTGNDVGYKKLSDSVRQDHSATTYKQDILSLARCYSFYLIVISAATTTFVDNIILTTVLDYAIDKHSPYSDAVWLISCLSLTDVIGRLCLPLLADCGCVQRTTLLALNQFLMGILMVAAPHASTFWHVVVICSATSVCIGCGVILHDVLVPDLIGLERLALVHGAIGTLRAPMMLAAPALIGYFRDRTGSYDDLYRLQGALLLGNAIMWVVTICRKKRTVKEECAVPQEAET